MTSSQTERTAEHAQADDIRFPHSGGEAADMIRRHDWSGSPVGPIKTWPAALRQAVDMMLATHHGMMLTWGPDLTLFYNDAYAPFLGLRHPQALGRSFRDVWSDEWDGLAPLVDKAMSGEAVWFEDFHLLTHRNGYPEDTWWQFSYSPIRDETGAIAGMLNVASEMTGKVSAERRLRALNADLERRVIERTHQRGTLWQVSSDMLAVLDLATGVIEAVNPAWTTTLGWAADEMEGHSYQEFIHPEDIAASDEAFARARTSETVIRHDNRYRTKGGDWRIFSWVGLGEGGKLYCTVRDITEERAQQAELAATQEALRQSQKMESMGQLTGGVAHDFNNLLTPIIGSLDMLMRRGVGSERERRLIDGALQSAERAKTLVQRLLAFARRQPLQATAVNIAAIVHDMTGLIESTIGPQITVHNEVSDDLPPAMADPNQLEMALLNLAVNARDAMPAGGDLTISATRESVRAGHGTRLKHGHYIRLAVSDTGVGMDEATRTRAVEPFFSTKGIGKGTGLGLSMVHGLVAQLGGRLMIDSAPDRGTTIALWLPVSLLPVVVAGEGETGTGLPPVRGQALLVDDEDLVRLSTADMLMDLGFDVVEAGSAEEALRRIEQGERPDILVTDHLMPGMTGVELAHALREIRPALPVLIVSGYAELEGIPLDTPRLTKPFRNADLAASLAALLVGAVTDAT